MVPHRDPWPQTSRCPCVAGGGGVRVPAAVTLACTGMRAAENIDNFQMHSSCKKRATISWQHIRCT
eukprot:11448501-Prorocentrum_lima.AAC.1